MIRQRGWASGPFGSGKADMLLWNLGCRMNCQITRLEDLPPAVASIANAT